MSTVVIPGAWFGRWRLVDRLGSGSFGSVWRAADEGGQPAALKILQAPPGDELRALAKVCHSAVPAVLDAGVSPAPYVAMELARGAPLSKMIRAGRAPEDRAVAVAALLADALSTIHHAGLTHADVKPDNVIVDSIQECRVWLVDFGLAGAVAGGTLQYAAPEQLASKAPLPASDVYALGLMLWEMLHGRSPWAGLDLAQALLRRRQETPLPSRGAPWVRDLLEQMLAVDPELRPSAGQVADTMAAHGARLPQPGPELLRRRARAVHIPRPGLDQALARWNEEGGQLVVTGPAGSGRSHTIEQAITELRARGHVWVRLVCHDRPWAGIEQALADPGLPGAPATLPADADPSNRAEAGAEALEERCSSRLAVVVDDLEHLDSGTAATLAALARRGRVSLCVAGEVAPEWAKAPLHLEPMPPAQLRALVSGILGSSTGLEALFETLQGFSGGAPGPAVDLLVSAVADGALVRRAHRWLVDSAALRELAARAEFLRERPVVLSEHAAQLGALLALWGLPAPTSMLSSLSGLSADALAIALRGLVDHGLVRVEGVRVCCTSRAAVSTLTRLCPDTAPIYQLLVDYLRDQPDPPLLQLGWFAVGARDEALLAARAKEMIAAARLVDGGEAARLASAIWSIYPAPHLSAPRLDALIEAGHHEQARAFGAEVLASGEPGLCVLIALARLSAGVDGDDGRAMAHIASAYKALGGAPPPLALLDVEGQTHFRAGRYREAISVARSVALKEPPEGDDLDTWLRLRGTWAQALFAEEHLTEAIEVLAAVPDELGRGRPARAVLQGQLGRLLWHDGRPQEAAEVLDRAAAADAGLPALDRARMLNNCALAHYHVGDRLGALARWEDALLLFERLGSDLEQVRVSANICVGYREAGRWERARQAGQFAYDAGRERGFWELAAMAAGNMGDLALQREQLDDAERWYDRARQLADAHQLTGEQVELARRHAELALRREDPQALLLARAAVTLAEQHSDSYQACLSKALAAVALGRQGKAALVDEQLTQAMTPLREAGAAGELAWVRLWAGEAYLALGRLRDALAECDRVAVFAEEMGHVPLRARADELMCRCRQVMSGDSHDERLDRLLELAVLVGRERDMDKLMGTIAEAALALLGCDRSFVLLGEGDPAVVAARSQDEGDVGAPSMSIVHRSIAGRREVIAADLGERGDLRAARSVLALDLRSAMCVPLIEGEAVLGAIYVDSRLARERDLVEGARFLRALASHAAVAVANAHHIQEVAGRARRAAEVAHDLRGPVSSIMTITRELQRFPPDSERLREALDDVEELCRRSISMVRGFLEGAEGGRSDDRADLDRVTRSLLALMRHELEERGVQIALRSCGRVVVPGNSDELGRVLMNLLNNALRFSTPGDVIEVSLELRDGACRWGVRDRGPGIPEDRLESIFDRGVQVSAGGGGYGLGLYIVRRVVRELGGEVRACNAPDGGACFSLILPTLAARAAA